MKKNLKWLMMAIVTLVMGVSLASCGGDDDDDNNGGGTNPPAGNKATEAYFQAGIYVTESTLKYFDVTVTDADGNKVADITADNTTLVTDTVFGDYLSQYKHFFTLKDRTNTTDNRLRLWTSGKETVKTFPTTKTYVYQLKANGTRPADDEKVYMVYIADVELSNNGHESGWTKNGVGGSYAIAGGFAGSKWDEISAKTFKTTTTITFEAADKVAGSASK